MNRCAIETTALLAQPLPRDANGNPRHFVPASRIPVAPGSKLARTVGLRMYRGKDRGPGFVIQSHHLTTALREIFAALDNHTPEGAPHALRSDGPLLFVLRLPGGAYRYLTEMFDTFTPSLIETAETFAKIVIPSGLPSPDCEAAVNMLMTFPILRSATIRHLSAERAGQYYGLEILIWLCDATEKPTGELTDPCRDRAIISSFLARNEPAPR